MAQRDQLEVVSPTGELLFFDLDERIGVTNVGRNASNDVVLAGQGVGDFHLMIDHRSTPYQLTVLDGVAPTRLGSERLLPNRQYPLRPWDNIQVGPYMLILIQGDAAPTVLAPAAVAVAATQVAPPVERAAPPAPAGPAPAIAKSAVVADVKPTNGLTAPPGPQTLHDLLDEIIVLEVSARQQIVDVEQTGSWQLTIINGGALVARFDVNLEGWIDGKWVVMQPTSVNLFEGGRTMVAIDVTPPRLPSSHAGEHHFAIVVTSTNYPGHRAQRAVTLVINPYYEFHVGEASPRQQSVNYFRRMAMLKLPVENRGNSDTLFRIEGIDDQNQVTFELMSPAEETRFARQVEFTLAPEQAVTVPISATPRNHRIVGVGTEQHALTLTTTMLGPQPSARSVLAQVRNRPVVGPWLIFAMLALIAAIVILVSQPSIESFAFAPGIDQTTVEGQTAGVSAQSVAGQAAALQGKKIFGIPIPKLPKLPRQLSFLNSFLPGQEEGTAEATIALPETGAMVPAGTDVILTWDTSRANSLTLEKQVGGDIQFIATIDDPSQTRQYSFRADLRERATYILTARNWIERIPYIGATFGLDESRLGLIVAPVEPVIEAFSVTPNNLVTGQSVNVTWQVLSADEYELLVNGVARPLESSRGSIEDTPATSTEYQLVARSPYWNEPVESARAVVAVALPTPVIRTFAVNPEPIVNGDGMQVAWDVLGATNVTIDPFPGDVVNLQGQEQQEWQDPGKSQQTFTLVATNGEGPDQVRAIATRVVNIILATPTVTPTPTETPTPLPTSTPIPTPLIRTFDIQPRPIVDGENVTIIWAVEGANDIEISPGVGSGLNLESQTEILLEPGKSQETFTLRAVANDGTSTVEVRSTRIVPIVTATPTVTPTPTPTPTSTPQTPVIQVFTLVPREVVRGDAVTSNADQEGQSGTTSTQPELTWTVVGDATMVEVSGPDFGPVRNLPKQGTLRVPADQTTVYQLNVYLGEDIVASETQELTVLEPTLTPTLTPVPTEPPPPPSSTPTPTFTPTPNIVSFTVNAVNPADQVVPVPSEDNVPTYQVEAGTQIRLAWRIENPVVEVRLTDSTNDYGSRSPEDEFQVMVTQGTVFQLTATGAPGRRIRINVTAIEPPPPPFNVNGVDSLSNTQPVTVTWDYPGESQGRILGFRVYRAAVDNFNFSRVADRFELGNTSKFWVDASTPSCDRVYYVVGVWEDITLTGDDRIRETEVSPSSWYTRPCP